MSRLASLTPSRARASPSPSPSPAPSPGRALAVAETTYHRRLRLVLDHVRALAKTWDEVVAVDGLKAGKGCIDEGTEMDNLLQAAEGPERPPVGPHLAAFHAHRAALNAVITKLEGLVRKLSSLIDEAEKLFFEALKAQPIEFSLVEPLWLTWTFEHCINTLPPLLSAHAAHLALLRPLAQTLLDPATPFDSAKLVLERWRDLALGGARWDAVREWEELVALETAAAAGADADEAEGRVRRKKR